MSFALPFVQMGVNNTFANSRPSQNHIVEKKLLTDEITNVLLGFAVAFFLLLIYIERSEYL